ncbi:MAG: sec-independent protein translocase protein TatB [Paracoccaceae bacterium]|jgi:sec-independent protein translocase protein TatB
MFDIGMVELLVIGVVALIVVGPKDLPGMFRTLGQFTAKARSMAREFQRSMEDAADESGIGDIAGDLKKATSVKNFGLDSVKSAVSDFAGGTFDEDASKKKIEAAKKLAAAGENTQALAAKMAKKKAAAADTVTALKAAKADEKKPAAKKPAAKKAASKANAVKKAAVKKPAAKAPAKTAPATKPSAAKSKPAAKKPAAKKPSAKAKAKS